MINRNKSFNLANIRAGNLKRLILNDNSIGLKAASISQNQNGPIYRQLVWVINEWMNE